MNQKEGEQGTDVTADRADADKPRRFLKYSVIWEHERPPVVMEIVRVNRCTPNERQVAFPTDIEIPEHVLRLMAADSKFEEEVMALASQLGAEIVATSRMRFSCPPNTTGADGVRAFHNYKLRGSKRMEEVPADKLPFDIATIARKDQDYHDNDDFLRWYWRYTGKRRNQVVSEEIRKHYQDKVVVSAT